MWLLLPHFVVAAPRSGDAAIVPEELAEAMQPHSKKRRRDYTPEFVKIVTDAAHQLGCAEAQRHQPEVPTPG